MACLPQLVTEAPLAHLRWIPAQGQGGDHPPVVMIHGVGGSRAAWAETWSDTGRVLAEAGHLAIAVDLPGYGDSPAITPYDLAGLAGAVADLIASLPGGLPSGRAVLVGHSLGGMVAQEVAARSPQCIAGLALVSTSSAFGKPDGDWQQAFLRSRFAPLDAGLGMTGLAAQLVPAMVAPGTAAERIAAAQALMARVPEATYRAALTALLAFDRRAALADIAVPTLVITGELDGASPPKVAEGMAARIPGARLTIVPGAGHLLNLEQPAALHAELRDLLARCHA
jgi:pimeloyl-ACP methyl ester carboxylesterase